MRATALVSGDLLAWGRNRAAEGYQDYVYEYARADHAIDPHDKAGADFDVLLRFQHGVANTNQCADGVSSNAQSRIVQTQPDPDTAAPRERFDVSLDGNYRLLGRAGLF